MVETTVRFLVDFRERAGLERVKAMTLRELLYWVMFGEEEVPVG